MICLDTNVVVGVMNGAPARLVARFLRELPKAELAISTIVLFELHYGAAHSARPVENADRIASFLDAPIAILPFEAEDAEDAGDIRAVLKRSGTPIGPYDVLIAAQARRRDAVLVTANVREFAGVPGLRVEDWGGPA